MLLRLLLVCALLSGCGRPASVSAPAPVSTPAAIDQQVATGLADAAAIIQGLTPLVAAYPGLKDPLNRAIALYQTVKAAENVYHSAVTNGLNPDATQLTAQIQQLLAAAGTLQSLYGGKP
jgi:hypothetical protein